MTESTIIKTELLSFLMTKVEYCSSDVYFKTKNLQFIGRSSQTLGRICGILLADELIERTNRTHRPSVWKTKLWNHTEGTNEKIHRCSICFRKIYYRKTTGKYVCDNERCDNYKIPMMVE